jgi:predicted RNA-binding Zn-ribbon protein involved in translation (DUF1610 family)
VNIGNNKQRKSKRTEKKQKNKYDHKNDNNKSRKQSLANTKTEDELNAERKEAYMEVPTQNLLRGLLKKGKNTEICPNYEPSIGFVYESIEPALQGENSSEKAAEFLEHLAQLDILKKSFFDTASSCPYCESTIMTLHYSCPKCKSHHIVKTSLTEHIPCGFIAEREKYIDEKCPRCGVLLIEDQYRDMGKWFTCRNCKEKFEHPRLEIICRKCNRNFSIEESKIIEIPKYSLNTARKEEIRQNIASLDGINKLLKELNFQIETPGILIGKKSGIHHHFSVVARKNVNDQEITVAIDHAASDNEVQSPPLIFYIYKTSEIDVDLPIFIAIPKLSDTAKKTAQAHQILVLEGSPESQEIIDQIRKESLLRLAQKTAPPPEPLATENQQQELEEDQATIEYRSEIKPHLFSTTSSIHQPQKSTKIKKPRTFLKGLRKTIKKPKTDIKET